MERVAGNDPASSVWKTEALPLDDTRLFAAIQLSMNQLLVGDREIESRPHAPKAWMRAITLVPVKKTKRAGIAIDPGPFENSYRCQESGSAATGRFNDHDRRGWICPELESVFHARQFNNKAGRRTRQAKSTTN